ncbi:MAG: 50S ribosomal protein L21 [bacterium]
MVKEGDALTVDLVDAAEGEKITLDKVVLAFDDKAEKVIVGKPYVKGHVDAEVQTHQQGDKVRTLKFKRKTRYQRTIGFRAQQTVLLIKKIQIDG